MSTLMLFVILLIVGFVFLVSGMKTEGKYKLILAIDGMRKEIERLENELKMVSYHLTKGEQLEHILGNTFKAVEDITDVHQMTNEQIKQIIQKIEVDKEGNVDILPVFAYNNTPPSSCKTILRGTPGGAYLLFPAIDSIIRAQ